MKAFLVVKKKKKKIGSDGKVILSSVSDIKKYDDATKWGSARAGQPLPSSYFREMEAFINAYKKSTRALKRMDEQMGKRPIQS